VIIPGMALQIVVERLIAAVEGRDIVLLFEPAYDNGHSASHCPDKGSVGLAGSLDARSARLSSSRGVQGNSTRGSYGSRISKRFLP
jgi:hypothetical protein